MKLIDNFDRLYCNLKYDKQGNLLIGVKHSILRMLCRKVSNAVLPIYLRLSHIKEYHKVEHNVILSLTSFPLRIGKLWMVIESLLRQTVRAEKIIVWLSKEQFLDMNSVPQSILRYNTEGVEVRLVDGDIRSHKKYYYMVNEFPESMFVTLDDDIIYPSHMLEELLEANVKYPHAVIARYAYEMKYEKSGEICSYSEWKRVMKPQKPSSKFFFGSGGGTLFPIGSLHSDVKNIDLAMRLCPTADDVFLNAQCRRNKTQIAVVDKNVALLNVQYKEDKRLATDNVDSGNANDVQIANINAYYREKIF